MEIKKVLFKHSKNYILVSLVFFLNYFFTIKPSYSSEENTVNFSGVYSIENKDEESSFQNFKKNKKELVLNFRKILEKLSYEKKLPFNLVFETDSETSKSQIDYNNYSLAIVITRDDINTETFEI